MSIPVDFNFLKIFNIFFFQGEVSGGDDEGSTALRHP
jgi:hypothetical protein